MAKLIKMLYTTEHIVILRLPERVYAEFAENIR